MRCALAQTFNSSSHMFDRWRDLNWFSFRNQEFRDGAVSPQLSAVSFQLSEIRDQRKPQKKQVIKLTADR